MVVSDVARARFQTGDRHGAGGESTAAPAAANIAARLTATAQAMPDDLAVVVPQARDAVGRRIYQRHTFRDLDQDSDAIAVGLAGMGVTSGTRLALLVRPGFDFISLVFALFKSGAVQVLIDPGIGRRNMIRCLAEAEPEGFVA